MHAVIFTIIFNQYEIILSYSFKVSKGSLLVW